MTVHQDASSRLSPDLDESQVLAIKIAPEHRQIVIAGPGSGKTEVVSALVEHLVVDEDVDPADGILVISFSNAAVHTVDGRLRSRGIAPVTVQTMDSLASEILMAADDVEIDSLTFDRRIELAVRLLRESDAAVERFANVEHLIVDEVQDVVGIRADFLLAIVDVLPEETGLSLLGDPAQGIYDFQIRPERGKKKPISATTSQDLLQRLSRMDGVERKRLTGQYRAASDDAREAAGLGPSVLSGGQLGELEDFEAGVRFIGSVEHVVELANEWDGVTAFLTQNNGQAMLVAERVAEMGARVEVRRSAQQRVLASWIARLLANSPTRSVSQAEVEKLIAAETPGLDAAIVWRTLKSAAGGKGSEIDIPRLVNRLKARRALPPDLLDAPSAPFVVSTIHRAKGLEFDNVVLIDFPEKSWADDDVDISEDARTRFVALTRARIRIVRTEGPDDRSLRQFSRASLHSHRWYRGGWQKWMTFGYEMRVDDIDRDGPGGIDPQLAQECLVRQVRVGDTIRLVLDLQRSTPSYPVYDMVHGDVVVARTSVTFGEDLATRIGTPDKMKRPWPNLAGARVETIATVAGTPQSGPVGRHGLWLAPVVTGILTIDWSRDDED
ncbi:UNVERIFIED_CONTAM: AAA family ATPase [Kocuria sp. CPCC 205316]|uniref:UvrD-helicase domain-containing protein n=1 Tax=Kocuria TaxID=57493 RepID=UPI0036D9DBF6